MNTANMRTLIDHLKWLRDNNLHRKFNMARWLFSPLTNTQATTIDTLMKMSNVEEPISATKCNTVACIAGHCLLLQYEKDEGKATVHDDAEVFARNWLGLTHHEADHLFYGEWSLESKDFITLEETIIFLEKCLETEAVLP